MGDLKRVETPGAYTVCKGTRSQMTVRYRGRGTKFEETVMEHKQETYEIITMNMKGKNYGKGTTNRRRERIVSFLKHSPISVIFCQEVPPKLEEEVEKNFGPGVYEFAFTDFEAAVVWRKSVFKGDRQFLEGNDPSSIKITERPKQTKSDVDVSELRTRTAMVKLTSVETGASFLAVSWHGPWRGTEENKLKAFHGLICFLREVCEMKNLSSFVIGGDFNLDTSRVDQRKFGVTISRYELCSRDQERLSLSPRPGRAFVSYKDTFIASVTVPFDEFPMRWDIRVSWVKPLELENQSSENSLLDHVPVVGVLELPCSLIEVRWNLVSIFSRALSL